MRIAGVAGIAILTAAGAAWDPADSAQNILAEVSETYRTATSFRLKLENKGPSGVPGSLGSKFDITLEAERGDKVRLAMEKTEFKSAKVWYDSPSFNAYGRVQPGHGGLATMAEATRTKYLLVTDGRTVWSLSDKNNYVNPARRNYYSAQAITDSLRDNLRTLIERYDKIDQMPDAVLIRRDGLNQVRCAVIASGNREFWIDESRHVVLLERLLTDHDGCTCLDPVGHDRWARDTLTWGTVELNAALPPGTFEFTPPKDAHKILSIELPFTQLLSDISVKVPQAKSLIDRSSPDGGDAPHLDKLPVSSGTPEPERQ